MVVFTVDMESIAGSMCEAHNKGMYPYTEKPIIFVEQNNIIFRGGISCR